MEPAKLISNTASIARIDSLATANDDTLVGCFDNEEMEDDILERAAIKGGTFADGDSSQHPVSRKKESTYSLWPEQHGVHHHGSR